MRRHLPYLRRFARAVTGSQKSGDAYVASTLEAMLADPSIFQPESAAPHGPLPDVLSILNSDGKWNTQATDRVLTGLEAAQRNLDMLAPPARQAFLLIAVEEFSPQDAALVIDVDAASCRASSTRPAAKSPARSPPSGHHRGRAADRARPGAAGYRAWAIGWSRSPAPSGRPSRPSNATRPGLILADIQLADGSSGLDAVNEILRTFSVPVIFVTAYPQRLLTGTRPEPTFLITKPFHPDNVKAIISQALFFDIRGRPEQPRLATA